MCIIPNLSFKNTSIGLSNMKLRIINQENSLFPTIKETLFLKELSTKESKLIRILDFAKIEKDVIVVKITNPPKHRLEIARAFIAKSVYNIQTTRDLIDRLKIDRTLRILCGWRYKEDIPSESKFSRVFKELSELKVAEKTHERFIKNYLSDTLFIYNASDGTKIPLRQKPVKINKEDDKKEKTQKRKRGRPKKGEIVKPKKPTILEQQQYMKNTKQMLSLITTHCGVGVKQNSKGHRETWIGGKLHLSVVDGDIPISSIYTSANIHDSSVALALMHETSKRVKYLYDLQDAGYDSSIIRDYSKKLHHKPIIDINPKNSKELKAKKQLMLDEEKKFEMLNLPQSSNIHHYNQRSMVERVNKYLKDDFGCNTIYYQGATKVASVLAFGILAICIHQSLKLVT